MLAQRRQAILHTSLTILGEDGSKAEGVNRMKFEMATPQVRPSKIPSEAHVSKAPPCADLALEPGVELATLVPKIASCSIAEFDKLVCEIQEAKKYLQSEEERIQREAANYANLAKSASASVKLISDTVRELHDAAHPAFNQARLTPAATE
jgi:hypothetical protein